MSKAFAARLRKVITTLVRVEQPSRAIQVTFQHREKGISYATYKRHEAGYVVALVPVRLEGEGDGAALSWNPMETTGYEIELAPRFNRKRLEALVKSEPQTERFKTLLATLCEAHGLTLKADGESKAA